MSTFMKKADIPLCHHQTHSSPYRRVRKKVISRVQKVSELSENVRTLRCAVSSLVLTQLRNTKAALGCNRLERFRGGVAA